MMATWLGGPMDGRTDELPDGVHAVSVAVPGKWAEDRFWGVQVPVGDYREARCPVIRDRHAGGFLILWHEPQ